MLQGHWKNIEELENNVNLDELNGMLEALRRVEERQMKFQAALKGIDLDEEAKENNQERLDAIKRRAEARLTGKTDEDFEKDDFAELGIDIEIE